MTVQEQAGPAWPSEDQTAEGDRGGSGTLVSWWVGPRAVLGFLAAPRVSTVKNKHLGEEVS